MPSGEAHVPMLLAGVTSVGGLMGYAKARSTMSLVGGLGVGAAYAASAWLINQNCAEEGHLVGTATSFLLAGAMARRFGKTGKFMPAGALAGVGLTGGLYHGLKYKEWSGH